MCMNTWYIQSHQTNASYCFTESQINTCGEVYILVDAPSQYPSRYIIYNVMGCQERHSRTCTQIVVTVHAMQPSAWILHPGDQLVWTNGFHCVSCCFWHYPCSHLGLWKWKLPLSKHVSISVSLSPPTNQSVQLVCTQYPCTLAPTRKAPTFSV